MATTGGKQVSLDKTELNGQGDVLVAIPGEAHPRDFSSPSGVLSDPCREEAVYSGYFCAYSGQNFGGSEIKMHSCQSYGIPWDGNGSWINDQTPGTKARFYRNEGSLLYTTPAPYASNWNCSTWTNVHTIRPC
ncbi:peptidase inhibitor family I36 protein [Streptomyces sp. NPDC030920]|uniref:peptidase inhibitor family I36 protein n=1 Tax=Streptomyces sp. NPDC030920 TaxID=3365308 RepID=UPI00384C4848